MDTETMTERTVKNLGGRPPLPEGKVKSEVYSFRVTPSEREIMDAYGDSDFWRQFCVNVAASLKYKESGEDTIGAIMELTRRTPGLLETLRRILAAADEEVLRQLVEVSSEIVKELDEEMKVDT